MFTFGDDTGRLGDAGLDSHIVHLHKYFAGRGETAGILGSRNSSQQYCESEDRPHPQIDIISLVNTMVSSFPSADSLALANALFVDERYAEAIEGYSALIAAAGNKKDWVSLKNRGLAYCRLGRFKDARADLEAGLEAFHAQLEQGNADNPKHLALFQAKLGEACFYLRDFDAARGYFGKTGDKLWLAKCDAEASASVLPLMQYLPAAAATSSGAAAAKSSSGAWTTEEKTKPATEGKPAAANPAAKTSATTASSNKENVGNNATTSGKSKKVEKLLDNDTPDDDGILVEEIVETPVVPQKKAIRHEWYQNDEFVIVSVYLKNLPQDRLELDIMEQKLVLKNNREETDALFVKEENQEKELALDLCDKIVPEESVVDHGKVRMCCGLCHGISLEPSIMGTSRSPPSSTRTRSLEDLVLDLQYARTPNGSGDYRK